MVTIPNVVLYCLPNLTYRHMKYITKNSSTSSIVQLTNKKLRGKNNAKNMTYSNTVCSHVYTSIISDPPSLQDLNLNLALDSYYHYEDKQLLTLAGFFHIQLHTMSLHGLYNVG